MKYDELRQYGKVTAALTQQDLPTEAMSDVILYWDKQFGTWYHNCMTGDAGYDICNIRRSKSRNIFLKKGSNSGIQEGYFVVPKKDIYGNDILVIAFCYFNIRTVPKENEGKRNWVITNCAYILDKKMQSYGTSPYDSTGGHINDRIDITSYSVETFENCYYYRYSSYTTNLLKEFSGWDGISYQMSPIPFGQKNAVEKLCWAKEVSISVKKQALTDNFTSLKLGKLIEDRHKDVIFRILISEFARDKINHGIDKVVSYACTTNRGRVFTIVQRASETIAVIRYVFAYFDAAKNDFEKPQIPTDFDSVSYLEYARTYVSDNETVDCQFAGGIWRYTKKGLDLGNFKSCPLTWDEEALKGTRMAYMSSINKLAAQYLEIGDNEKWEEQWETYTDLKRLGAAFHTMLSSPLIESFISSEYKNILRSVNHSMYITKDKEILTSVFGPVDFSCRSLIKAIGVPSFMLKEADRLAGEKWADYDASNGGFTYRTDVEARFYATVICKMKAIFSSCPEYLTRMNKNTFLQFVDALHKIEGRDGSQITLQHLIELYGPNNFLNYVDFLVGGLDKIVAEDEQKLKDSRRYYCHSYARSDYSDYLEMLIQMDGRLARAPWRFSNFDDFKRAHDETTKIYNLLKDKIQYEKVRAAFDVRKKGWNKFLYEEDEYCVISPEKAEDIANEGLVLHHCVKNYIDKVAKGETIILFIRSIQDRESPFYTLEIRDGKVRQCHGMQNSNIDEAEGLTEFLQRYCKAKKIQYSYGGRALGV